MYHNIFYKKGVLYLPLQALQRQLDSPPAGFSWGLRGHRAREERPGRGWLQAGAGPWASRSLSGPLCCQTPANRPLTDPPLPALGSSICSFLGPWLMQQKSACLYMMRVI